MHGGKAVRSMKRSSTMSGIEENMRGGKEVGGKKRSSPMSGIEETCCKKARHCKRSIEDLMKEVQTEIFARVAADSYTDIANCKLSCKLFKDVAEDRFVYRHASLDKISIILWSPTENELKFLEKCRESMNPEIIYREAVVDFFNKKSIGSTSRLLKRAVKQGHEGAMYLTSIVLIFSGDKECKENGIKLLSSLGKEKARECREKLIKLVKALWVSIEKSTVPVCCTLTEENHKERMVSKLKNCEDGVQCEACFADFEIKCIFDAAS